MTPSTNSQTGSTRRCAVLGHPIDHSLSPSMHRAAYQYLGLEWSYDAFDVEEGGLATFVHACDAQWRGLSLTMPLKVEALDVATKVEPLARTLQSVNTLILEGGEIVGYNTDALGLQHVIEAGLGPDPGPTSVTVLGAGATARSALGALGALGALAASGDALDIQSVTVCARRPQAVEQLITLGSELGLVMNAGSWPPAHLAGEDGGHRVLVINTLPLPAASQLAGSFSGAGLLIDVLYHPWPTPLAQRWADNGGVVIGGVEMLVMQGVAQATLMTGREVPPHVLRDAAMGELDRRNIAQAEQ